MSTASTDDSLMRARIQAMCRIPRRAAGPGAKKYCGFMRDLGFHGPTRGRRHARPPDPRASRAVVIGVGRYRSAQLENAPAVVNGAMELQRALSTNRTSVFQPEYCVLETDPATPGDIARVLSESARCATDVFLVYFAGHGLRDEESQELHLALRDTELQPGLLGPTSLSYSTLRTIFAQSRALVRVLILDCCFSGVAARGSLAAAARARPGSFDIEGTFILTSCGPTQLSPARTDRVFTPFTGELLKIMRSGIRGAEPWITLETIYQNLAKTLRGPGIPQPHVQRTDDASALALVGNAAFIGGHDPGRRQALRRIGIQRASNVNAHERIRHQDPARRHDGAIAEQSAGIAPEDSRVPSPSSTSLVDPSALDARRDEIRLLARRDPSAAMSGYEELTAAYERIAGTKDQAAIQVRVEHAECAMAAGDAPTAIRLVSRAIDDTVSALGAEDPLTLRYLKLHADWSAAVDPHAARGLLHDLLEPFRRSYGAHGDQTLALLAQLARCCADDGDTGTAAGLMQEVVESLTAKHGADHQRTLAARHARAHWIGRHEGADAAVRLLRSLLAAYRLSVGRGAPEALSCQHNLAYWTHQAGDAVTARTIYASTADARTRVLGADHPDTVASREAFSSWSLHREAQEQAAAETDTRAARNQAANRSAGLDFP